MMFRNVKKSNEEIERIRQSLLTCICIIVCGSSLQVNIYRAEFTTQYCYHFRKTNKYRESKHYTLDYVIILSIIFTVECYDVQETILNDFDSFF